MKIQNISLPDKLKELLERVKWHLWRGDAHTALSRLEQLMEKTKNKKDFNKLKKFTTYISNNCDKIVNYMQRQKAGLVFTSSLAESTVESLINRRCKGRQHMRWSRKGLNPILQLRALVNSQSGWESKIRMAILNIV